MLGQSGGKERIAYAVLVGALLLLTGYVGGRYLHRTAPIVFTGTPPVEPASVEAAAPPERKAAPPDAVQAGLTPTPHKKEPETAAAHPAYKRKPLPPPASVSLNGADLRGLQALPGVGPATARRILDYRARHGRFKTVDELLAVDGIGPKKLAKMRRYVRL